MKEEVLNKFVSEMLVMLQDARAFAGREIPEICREVIVYGRAKETAYAVIGLVFLVLAGKAFLVAWRKDGSKEMDAQFALGMGGVLGTLVGCLVLGNSLNGALLAWFAPRLYLIEYFSKLVSK